MLIRQAGRADKDALLDIVARCWDKDTARRADIELDQAFRDHDWRPVVYVAETASQVVGCAAHIASWTYFGVYDLTWVNVHPDFQRKGVGKALVNRVIEAVEPLGHLVMFSTHIPEYYARHWQARAIYRHKEGQVIMVIPLMKRQHYRDPEAYPYLETAAE